MDEVVVGRTGAQRDRGEDMSGLTVRERRLLVAAIFALRAYRMIFPTSHWNTADRFAFGRLEREIDRYRRAR